MPLDIPNFVGLTPISNNRQAMLALLSTVIDPQFRVYILSYLTQTQFNTLFTHSPLYFLLKKFQKFVTLRKVQSRT